MIAINDYAKNVYAPQPSFVPGQQCSLVRYVSERSASYRAIYPLIMDKESNKALTLHVAETRDKVFAFLYEGVDVATIYHNHGAERVA